MGKGFFRSRIYVRVPIHRKTERQGNFSHNPAFLLGATTVFVAVDRKKRQQKNAMSQSHVAASQQLSARAFK